MNWSKGVIWVVLAVGVYWNVRELLGAGSYSGHLVNAGMLCLWAGVLARGVRGEPLTMTFGEQVRERRPAPRFVNYSVLGFSLLGLALLLAALVVFLQTP